jgi:hypothetical protein
MAIWAASPAGSQVPFFRRLPQHLVLHGQLTDLAFGLLQGPIIGAAVRPLTFEALLAGGQEVIAPGGQPMGLDLELRRQLLQRLTAQQSEHRLGLLPGRPARLRPMVLALLVMVVHRHEAIFTLAYPVSNPTGSGGQGAHPAIGIFVNEANTSDEVVPGLVEVRWRSPA